MDFKTFITLLVVGGLVGVIAVLTGKGAKATAPLHIIAAVIGAFLGWIVLTQIRGVPLQVIFAVCGSVLMLWLVRLIKKSK